MSEENKIDDGGAAFPSQYHEQHDPAHYHGMSLRQWYAGMALQGIIASEGETRLTPVDEAAKRAFVLADAMIAAGKEKP